MKPCLQTLTHPPETGDDTQTPEREFGCSPCKELWLEKERQKGLGNPADKQMT